MLEPPINSVKKIFELFDYEKSGSLTQEGIRKCYELISSSNLKPYLNNIIFLTLKSPKEENQVTENNKTLFPITIENLQTVLCYYHQILKYLENAHLEHEVLSHGSDCMSFKVSRAFCELAMRRELSNVEWDTFVTGRFEPELPIVSFNEIEPLLAKAKVDEIDLNFIRQNAKRARNEKRNVARLMGITWDDDILSTDDELRVPKKKNKIEEVDDLDNLEKTEFLSDNYNDLASQMLADYLRGLHGKDFDRERLLKYLQFKKDALYDKNGNAASILLNDQEMAEALKNLKKEKFAEWLKNRRAGLSKDQLKILDEAQDEGLFDNLEFSSPDNEKGRENDDNSEQKINQNYDLLAANLMSDYLKGLYGQKFNDRDKLQAYLQFKKDAYNNKYSDASRLLLNDAELQAKLREIQKQKMADYLASRRKGGKKLSDKEISKLENTLLANIEEEDDLKMAPATLWMPPSNEAPVDTSNFNLEAANLLSNYLKNLYGSEYDRDKIAAYLKFKKDALQDRNSKAAKALINDAELMANLKQLQRLKFEEYLKNKRVKNEKITTEQMEKLKMQEETLLGDPEEENWDLKMAPEVFWAPSDPTKNQSEGTESTEDPNIKDLEKRLNQNFDTQAADLLSNYLKQLYGTENVEKDRLAAYLQFKKDAMRNKNGQAASILLNDIDLAKNLKKLQKEKFKRYLAERKGQLSKEEIKELKSQRDANLLADIGEEFVDQVQDQDDGNDVSPISENDLIEYQVLVRTKFRMLTKLLRSYNNISDEDLQRPTLLVSTKYYGDSFENFQRKLNHLRESTIFPNIYISPGNFLVTQSDKTNSFEKEQEFPLKNYIFEESQVLKNSSPSKILISSSWQLYQIILLKSQLQSVEEIVKNAKELGKSIENEEIIEQLRANREIILTNLGSRINFLNNGELILPTDFHKYLLAMDYDKKLEIDFGLRENSLFLQAQLEELDQVIEHLVPKQLIKFLSEKLNFEPNKIKNLIKKITNMLTALYRAHHKERDVMLKTLTDTSNSKLRTLFEGMTAAGRQQRLLEIVEKTNQIENAFGIVKNISSLKSLIQSFQKINGLGSKQNEYFNIENEQMDDYEDLFDEAGAIAFINVQKYLRSFSDSGDKKSNKSTLKKIEKLGHKSSDVINFILAELRHDQDRKRALLIKQLLNLEKEKDLDDLIEQLTRIFILKQQKNLVPNAYSVLCQVKNKDFEDFHIIRCVSLPYELAKIHYFDADGDSVAMIRKRRMIESDIDKKITTDDISNNQDKIYKMYETYFAQNKNSSEPSSIDKTDLWKLGQLAIFSKKAQLEVSKTCSQEAFKLLDRAKFCAWAYKIGYLVNLFPESLSNLLLADGQLITSLIAGRHSLTNYINQTILSSLHIWERVEGDPKITFLANFSLKNAGIFSDSYLDNHTFLMYISYQFLEIQWLKNAIGPMSLSTIKLFAAQSNIQELWEELERTMISSKSWKNSGVVELDWPGLNRALELRAAIEYREQLNEASNENENLKNLDENGQSLLAKKIIEPNPHYGLIKELWNTQNIIYDLWISSSINLAENIDLCNKINAMIEKNQSISIAKMLTKINVVENDYLDDALVRNLMIQHGNAAWNRLSDQEKFENLQKTRVELLKARKFGTNDQTIKNLMIGLDNDREFQMANKLKQQQRLEELKQLRAVNRNLSVTEQKLESFKVVRVFCVVRFINNADRVYLFIINLILFAFLSINLLLHFV